MRLLQNTTYRRDVEGLRAVAVLLVVAYHYRIPGFEAGFIGVDIFFVISGYLITRLIVAEVKNTGSIDTAMFYGRRAKRLLPALLLMSLCTLLASAILLAPAETKEVAKSAFAASTYVSNLWFASHSFDYFAPETGSNPFLHTWSLSAEEQLYLLWPALIVVAARRRRDSLFWVVAGVTAASFAACWIAAITHQPLAFFFPLTRAWEFGAGALASFYDGRTAARYLAFAGSLLIGVAMLAIGDSSVFPGPVTLFPVLGSVMVLLAGNCPNRSNAITALLSTSPAVCVGKLSYSIYLWHWPTLIFGDILWPENEVMTRAGCAAATLVAAVVSYKLLEHPIRTSLWFGLRRRALVLGASVTCIGMVSAYLAWASADLWGRDAEQVAALAAAMDQSALHTDPRECISPLLESTPRRCDFLEGVGTIVLLGDSHAAQWFTPIAEFAKQRGLKLSTFVKSSCAVTDVPVTSVRLRRVSNECAEWRRRVIDDLRTIKPELVVVSQFSSAYVGGRVAEADWIAGFERSLSALSKLSNRVIVLSDTPSMGFHVPTCLSRSAIIGRSCDRTLGETVNVRLLQDEQHTASAAGVDYLNVVTWFCSNGLCPARQDSLILYKDSNHISEAYAAALSARVVKSISVRLPALQFAKP